ncbi:MAG: hypothetical protein CL831_10400 [Crocinitomicaceae bacterium]|nr:hypothetical protein [Crocinitomicaceae bacterium]
MRTLFAFLTCLIGVSLVGQDCEFNSINIEVVGSDAAIGWNITQDNGWALVSGALDSYENICFEDGCYPFNMYDGDGDGWIETTITISYSLTNEVIFSGTLEYGNVESLNIQIGDSIECTSGCIDPSACNYSNEASEEDGSCIYPEEGDTCDSFCQEDLNSDGVITIQDLLLILSEFGCITACENDITQDGYVSVDDLLLVLSEFGNSCEAEPEFSCGDDDISHEGYDYSTVLIGDQCWFSENCRYLPEVSPSTIVNATTPYYYVYGFEGTDVEVAKSTENYETYGVLYNWPAVMTEGICPTSWHMPSDEEWQSLEISLGMSASIAMELGFRGTDEGYQMKSISGWYNNGNGTNTSGFNSKPGGLLAGITFYYGLELHAFWWTSTATDNNYLARQLVFSDDSISRQYENPTVGFSARCIKD